MKTTRRLSISGLQGGDEAVEAVIMRARRGPPHAEVAEVVVTDAVGEVADFRTLPTE